MSISDLRKSAVGKLLPEALYLHKSALKYAPEICKKMLEDAIAVLGTNPKANLYKFGLRGDVFSFLFYKDFDDLEHPELLKSITINLKTKKVVERKYGDNPPILHRKETFVHPSYPQYSKFKAQTEKEERLGVLNRRDIGFKKPWEALMKNVTSTFLKKVEAKRLTEKECIENGFKTAISRTKPSAPSVWLNRAGLLKGRVLDYGCGRGLDAKTFKLEKYDPTFYPKKPEGKFDTILCTYVLNVMNETMANKVLAKIKNLLAPGGIAYISVRRDVKEDGCTTKGTYQRNVVLDRPMVHERKNLYAIYKITK